MYYYYYYLDFNVILYNDIDGDNTLNDNNNNHYIKHPIKCPMAYQMGHLVKLLEQIILFSSRNTE